MAVNYRMTDTAGGNTTPTGKTANSSDNEADVAAEGGTSGTVRTMFMDASASDKIAFTWQLVVGSHSRDAGTWTVPLNITASNANITIASVTVTRVDSGGTQVEQLGQSNALGISCSTTGVKTVTLSGTAPGTSAGDHVQIAVGFSNAAASVQSFDLTRNQDITAPFDAAVPASWPAGTRRAPGQRGPFDRRGFLASPYQRYSYVPSVVAAPTVILQRKTLGTTGNHVGGRQRRGQ